MQSIIKSLLLAVLIGSTMTGCTSQLSPDSYSSGSAGQVNRVVAGKIVSARYVTVKNSSGDNMLGTVIGGLAGGAAGSTIGQGNGSILAAVGGAVLGGVVGNQVQGNLSKQQGIEYIVKTKNGNLISVVQSANSPQFQRGVHVLVEYGDYGNGSRARVIQDPDYQ